MYSRRHSRKGQNLPEIAIVVSLVAIAAILVVTLLGNTIVGLFSNLTTGVINGPPPATLVVTVVAPSAGAPDITVTGPGVGFPKHPTASATYTDLIAGVYTITANTTVGTVVPTNCVSTCPAPIPATFYPAITSPTISVPSYSHTSVVDYTNTVPDTVHIVDYSSSGSGGNLGLVSAASHTAAVYAVGFTSFANLGFTPAVNDVITIQPSPLTSNGLAIQVSSVGASSVVGFEVAVDPALVCYSSPHFLCTDSLGTGNIACYSTSNVFNPCLSSVAITTQRTYTVTFGNSPGITGLSFYSILNVGDVIDFAATTDDTLIGGGVILSGKSTPLVINSGNNTITGLQGTIGDLFLQAAITSSVTVQAPSVTVPLTSAIGTLAPPHASNSPSFGCGTDALHYIPPASLNLQVHGNISLVPNITFTSDIFIADFWKDQSNDRFGITAIETDTYHGSLTSTTPFSVFCQVSVPAILDLKLPRIVLWDVPPIWIKPDIALNASLELTWVPPTGSTTDGTYPEYLAESRSNCPDNTQPCGQWFTLDGTITASLGFDCSPSFQTSGHPSSCNGIHTLDFGHPTVNLQGHGDLLVKFGPRLNLKIEDFAGPYFAAYGYDKFSTSNATPPVPVDAGFNGLGPVAGGFGNVSGCQNDEAGIAFSIGVVVGIGPIDPLKSLVNIQLAEVYAPLFCFIPMTGGSTGGTSISTTPTASHSATSSLLDAVTNLPIPTATGTVTYTVYSNSACTTVATTGSGGQIQAQPAPVTVVDGTVPSSPSVTFNIAGTYYWKDVYSGDISNAGSTSGCVAFAESKTHFAYVVNQHDGTVTKINIDTKAVIGSPLSVGIWPIGEAISPDGSTLYVLNQGDDGGSGVAPGDQSVTVVSIDTATMTSNDSLPLFAHGAYDSVTFNNIDAEVLSIAVNPVTGKIYVGSLNSCNGGCFSSVRSTNWNIEVINPDLSVNGWITWSDNWGSKDINTSDITFSADGNTAFTTDPKNGDMNKIENLGGTLPNGDTNVAACDGGQVCVDGALQGNGTVTSSFCCPTGYGGFVPKSILVSGGVGYVTDGAQPRIFSFSLTDLHLIADISAAWYTGTYPTGAFQPWHNCVTEETVPAGSQTYTSCAYGTGGVARMPLSGGEPTYLATGTQDSNDGGDAQGMVYDATSHSLWVTNRGSGTVSAIENADTASPTVDSPISVGSNNGPVAVVVG